MLSPTHGEWTLHASHQQSEFCDYDLAFISLVVLCCPERDESGLAMRLQRMRGWGNVQILSSCEGLLPLRGDYGKT